MENKTIKINYNLLEKYNLCHKCFGRLYGKSLQISNYERGKSLKLSRAIELQLNLEYLKEELNKLNSEELISSENNEKITIIQNKINNIINQLKILYNSGLTEINVEIFNDLEYINKNTCNNNNNNNNKDNKDKTNIGIGENKYSCPYCKDIFKEEHINDIVEKILKFTENYEFETFLIGTKLPKVIKDFEKELIENNVDNLLFESIKNEVNRTIGKIISEKTGKKVNKENPDIVIMINPYNKRIDLQINPIFIKGRYKKLIRGIPQSHWHCRSCRGKGCEKCNFTGKQYETSVEEIIAKPFMEVFKGTDEAFHGAGREDIDVRMLGNGRPFVLQIKEPKIRKVDLKPLVEKVNSTGIVEINSVEYGIRKDVIFFKNEAHKKTYLAHILCEEEVSKEEIINIIDKMKNLKINQRTPNRVSHRRADLIRERFVYNVQLDKIINSNEFTLKIYCDGGLYIKELISGDEGRTPNSVSDLLGKKCICKYLDVLNVHDFEEHN